MFFSKYIENMWESPESAHIITNLRPINHASMARGFNFSPTKLFSCKTQISLQKQTSLVGVFALLGTQKPHYWNLLKTQRSFIAWEPVFSALVVSSSCLCWTRIVASSCFSAFRIWCFLVIPGRARGTGHVMLDLFRSLLCSKMWCVQMSWSLLLWGATGKPCANTMFEPSPIGDLWV